MPIYDRGCESCGYYNDCCLEKWDAPDPPCPNCGGKTYRPWKGKSAAVIPDTFATPMIDRTMAREDQRFESRSEWRAAMKKHGVRPMERGDMSRMLRG